MPRTIITCDWGTTRFRLRAIDVESCRVAAEFRSTDGVASLAQDFDPETRAGRYRSILTAGVRTLTAPLEDALKGAPILISGMAGSSIGWQEAPYAPLPLPLDGSRLTWHELEPIESEDGPHRVILIAGARSATDVMRGEETEIVGLFTLPIAQRLSARSLVIKPGTHSKHVRVENGEIVGLESFMTGELFDVLSKHSILSHSVTAAQGAEPLPAETTDDLRAGVRHAVSIPLASALFRVRTRQLLDNLPAAQNRAFLSGVLLGGELSYLALARLDGLPLVLCATAPLSASYRAALDELGLAARVTAIPPDDVELLSARGQVVLWRKAGGG